MTVIAAWLNIRTGIAAMASDSEMTEGSLTVSVARKMVRRGAAIVGVAGDYGYVRMVEKFDPLAEGADGYEWTYALVDAAFKHKPPLKVTETEDGEPVAEGEQCVDLGLVVLTRSAIYSMNGWRVVAESADNYAAAGTGRTAALGALALAETLGLSPVDAVRLSVESAKRHGHGCGGPTRIEMLGAEPKPRARRKKS